MKKTIFTVLAAVALVACAKEEVVTVNQEAIAFENAFVDNATKSVNDPSFTNSNLFNDFAVYGFVEEAVLFDGTQVSGSGVGNGASWTYSGTQYWIAGADYNFHAVAPMTAGGWTKTDADATSTTLSFTNNGTTDLLYATKAQEGKVSENEKVAFSFRHVLSKVKFSFENAYNATNATIKVKDVKITDAYTTATATLSGVTSWAGHASDNLVLDFGAAVNEGVDDDADDDGVQIYNTADAFAYNTILESYNELFLIPSVNSETNHSYTVTFTVELLVSGTYVTEYSHTVTATFAPVPGHSYDIKAVINAANIDPAHSQEPIEFTVTTISDWDTTNSDVNAQ